MDTIILDCFFDSQCRSGGAIDDNDDDDDDDNDAL